MKRGFFLVFFLSVLHQAKAVHLEVNNKTSDFILDTNLTDVLPLHCEAKNHTGSESLIWYRDSRPLSLEDEHNINSSHVCIAPLSPSDNGIKFICLLKSNTSIKRIATLNVTFCPILSGENSLTVEEGNNVKLACGVQANPQADMSWKKNGTSVKMQSHYTQYLTKNAFELSFTKIKIEDSGTYVCSAVSTYGTTTRDFILVVEARKDVLPVEAICAAVVVGFLTIAFGVFARRDKIFKKCMKSRDGTSL
ncbi:transmembrane and immunoglobulin domain-containing protein 1 [Bombina bombina]|uniref:transmembrane and immunoglobulin domain-containing protein 1 n=1 Tax=Bombina bombina TaxID=8345 RepID=UPI00235A954E|nr:transmembrane and immunoglobulin domain-containing protein 1 [Bombina bombina]